ATALTSAHPITRRHQPRRLFAQLTMPSAAALLARRLGRPYLEVDGRANWALVAWERSTRQAVELSMQAVELARRHGGAEGRVTAPAYVVLGVSSLNQGRLEQAKSWLDRAERAVRPEVQPAEGITAHYARGAIKLACWGAERWSIAAMTACGLCRKLGIHHAP